MSSRQCSSNKLMTLQIWPFFRSYHAQFLETYYPYLIELFTDLSQAMLKKQVTMARNKIIVFSLKIWVEIAVTKRCTWKAWNFEDFLTSTNLLITFSLWDVHPGVAYCDCKGTLCGSAMICNSCSLDHSTQVCLDHTTQYVRSRVNNFISPSFTFQKYNFFNYLIKYQKYKAVC